MLLTHWLLTGLLTSLLGWSHLLVAELRRLLSATRTLLARLVLLARRLGLGSLLAPGFGRPTSCSASLDARLLVTVLLEVLPTSSLALAVPERGSLWSLLSITCLARLGGRALLCTLLPPLAVLSLRRLSAPLLVPSPTVLSALALAAAVLLVHVVARPKVRRRANKRRPPFTWTGRESLC